MDGSRSSQSKEIKKADTIADTSKPQGKEIWLSQHEREAQAKQLRKEQELDTSFRNYNKRRDIEDELNAQSLLAVTEYTTHQRGLNPGILMKFEVKEQMMMFHDFVTKQTCIKGQQHPEGPWENYSSKEGKGK